VNDEIINISRLIGVVDGMVAEGIDENYGLFAGNIDRIESVTILIDMMIDRE
jgi:hypothetical protein